MRRISVKYLGFAIKKIIKWGLSSLREMKLSDDFNKYNEGFLCQNEACQMNMKLCHLQTSSLSKELCTEEWSFYYLS